MSDSAANLHHKIISARELGTVVRTMKAMAASNIGQYENAVRSLDEYYRTVQLALAACFRQGLPAAASPTARKDTGVIGAIVFGSDQGLAGQFNEVMTTFVVNTLEKHPGKKIVWTVGERLQTHLAEVDLPLGENFVLPNSVSAITPLVGQILIALESQRTMGAIAQIYLFHHHPKSGAIYTPECQRLLPPDHSWYRDLSAIRWPTGNLPQVLHEEQHTLQAFIREYLFVSLFRACAESLASENASRLAAMQRAEKNIDDLLEGLNRMYYRMRQSRIDEELFDVVSGFEALTGARVK